MANQEKIIELFSRYLNDRCSYNEQQKLFNDFLLDQNEELLKSLLKDEFDSIQNINVIMDSSISTKFEIILQKILKNIDKPG